MSPSSMTAHALYSFYLSFYLTLICIMVILVKLNEILSCLYKSELSKAWFCEFIGHL